MRLLKLSDGTRITINQVYALHPEISPTIPSIEQDLLNAGYAIVYPSQAPVLRLGEELVEIAPSLSGGKYYASYAAVPIQFPSQESFDEYLATKKDELLTAIATIAMEKRNAITANISPAEMASWTIKRNEALKFVETGVAADAPVLTLEAQARNVTLQVLVDKVLAKADSFSHLEALISGTDGKHSDYIKSATTIEQLRDYDIYSGWDFV